MAEKITAVPDSKAKSMKLKRDNLTFKLDWDLSKNATSDSNKKRATKQRVIWLVWHKDPQAPAKGQSVKYAREKEYGTSKTDDKLSITRSKWFPTGDIITEVIGVVRLGNSKGYGKDASVSYKMSAPSKPKVEASYKAETGTVSFKITPSKDDGHQEVYDTGYKIYKSDRNGKFKGTGLDPIVKSGTFAGKSARTVTYDVKEARELNAQQVIIVRCYAWCRGIGGASGNASDEYPVGFPVNVNLGGGGSDDTLTYKCTGFTNRDRIIFYLQHHNDKNPYTGKSVKKGTLKKAQKIQLQVLKNSDIDNVDDADVASGFEDVSGSYATDDNESTALIDYVENARPDRGKHVWYRVKAERDGFISYSKPVEIVELFRAEIDTAGAVCNISSVEQGADGTSAYATVTWDTADEMTGTELSWSDDPEAWISTSGPDTATFDDAAADTGSLRAKIVDLTSGATVYVRARRYGTVDNATKYGPYCEAVAALVSSAPTQVVAEAPEWVATGSGARISWTFGGGGTQTAWQISSGGNIVLNGTGPQGSAVVPAETLAACASGEVASFTVEVSTGGAFVASNEVQVGIADPPSVSIADATITAQPVTLAVSGTDSTACSLHVDVLATGAIGQGPGGDWYQPDGLSIIAADFRPDWSGGTMACELPYSPQLVDGADYRVIVTATDETTGLSSASDPATLTVAWAHQAAAPSESSTVTYRHDEDSGERSCTIVPVAPEGAAPTDVCDIYRVTPLSSDLIGEGVAFGSQTVDLYAPFSSKDEAETRYRLVTRTADGDEDWLDFGYTAVCDSIRIDWPGGYVELPYSPKASYESDKGMETRSYMDGGIDGFWPAAATVSGSLDSTLVRVGDPVQAEALLAVTTDYQGACFVRIPDGNAFAADVQLGSYDSGGGPTREVELDFTRLRLPAQYMIALPSDEASWPQDETEAS